MKTSHLLALYPLIISIFVVFYLVLFYFVVPPSFWLAQGRYQLSDMCVGDTHQFVYQERTPRKFIEADSWDQLVKIDDQTLIETTIFRGTPKDPIDFAYEGGTEARYIIEWGKPVKEPGHYGANFNITIYPLPLIALDIPVSAIDTQFNVVQCE